MKKILLFIVCWIVAAATVQAQNQTQKSTSIVTIGGESYYVHTVKPGDTFYSLCKVYDTDEDSIRASNPHVADGLQARQVIKIPVVKGVRETAFQTVKGNVCSISIPSTRAKPPTRSPNATA